MCVCVCIGSSRGGGKLKEVCENVFVFLGGGALFGEGGGKGGTILISVEEQSAEH